MFDYLDYKNKIPLDKCLIDIPRLNPLSINYEKFWIHTVKRKQIEGHWVEHEGLHKWLPGPIFQYVNLWNIEMKKKEGSSKGKVIGRPRLRDIEWIKGYVHAVARGFSGFKDDSEYSCHLILINPDIEEVLPYQSKSLRDSIYKPDGSLKTYKPALEYLYEYPTSNLGKPLYLNQAFNVVDIECRNIGKTVSSGNFCGHNFLTDGVMDFDEWWLNKQKPKDHQETYTTQTLIGASDSKYINNLNKHLKIGLEYLPGKMEIGKVMYPAPLSKKYSGSWIAGKDIIAKYEEKIGGKWEVKGSGSGFLHRTFKDNEFAANGTRYGFGLVDEVGFMGNLIEVLGQLHECTTVDGEKYGTIWMCVCEGTKVWTRDGRLVNIEDLKQEDGIIGWDESTKSSSPTSIVRMFPPSDKECYRLTTNTGRVLECSHDHPILWSRIDYGSRPRSKDNPCNRKFIKKTVFKEASEIKVGDQVAIAESVEVFGTSTIWEPRFVGMLIGDGSYGLDSTPVLSNCDPELNDYIDNKFDTVTEKSYITKDGRLYRETRIRKICPELRKLGIYGQTKLAKRLPEIITSCDKQTILELLGGFYDTDGHVTIDKNGKAQIGLTSSSKDLLEEVRLLLQKLGIHGSIQTCLPRKENRLDRNVYYKLVIADNRSLLLFSDNIKLLVKYKQEKLNIISAVYRDRPIRQSGSIEGLRFERVVSVESIGVKQVYNLTAAGHNTYMANGIVTHNTGTGGDMDGGATEAVKKVFYKPASQQCLEFDDVFENSGRKIGFFVPAWMALDEFRDELGNVNKELALKKLTKERSIAIKGDKNSYNMLLQMKPLVPSEAFLSSGGNIFNRPELQSHIKDMESSTDGYTKGRWGNLIQQSTNHVVFEDDFSNKLRPCEYPLEEKHDKTGCVVVWEEPIDNPPYGYYIASLDPYAKDQAPNSVSVGSMFIMKRCMVGGASFDEIVAEYSGRPETLSEFYDNCRKLLIYYNAICLFENNVEGFKTYMQNRNSLHLLAKEPTALKKNKIDAVANVYGWNTNNNKDEMEMYLRDWLYAEAGDGKLNLHHIYSVPLLKELEAYNDSGNYDRVISACLLIIQKIQMHKVIAKDKESKKKSWWLTHKFNGV